MATRATRDALLRLRRTGELEARRVVLAARAEVARERRVLERAAEAREQAEKRLRPPSTMARSAGALEREERLRAALRGDRDRAIAKQQSAARALAESERALGEAQRALEIALRARQAAEKLERESAARESRARARRAEAALDDRRPTLTRPSSRR